MTGDNIFALFFYKRIKNKRSSIPLKLEQAVYNFLGLKRNRAISGLICARKKNIAEMTIGAVDKHKISL